MGKWSQEVSDVVMIGGRRLSQSRDAARKHLNSMPLNRSKKGLTPDTQQKQLFNNLYFRKRPGTNMKSDRNSCFNSNVYVF